MSAHIEDLLREIENDHLTQTVTSDRRGTAPGGAVTIEITRESEDQKTRRNFATLVIRTLPPFDRRSAEASLYTITDVSIDSSVTFKARRGTTASEIWLRILEFRQGRTPMPPGRIIEDADQEEVQAAVNGAAATPVTEGSVETVVTVGQSEAGQTNSSENPGQKRHRRRRGRNRRRRRKQQEQATEEQGQGAKLAA